MKKLWFKAKTYGWGWYPSTWQGWIITAIYIIALVLLFRKIDYVSHSASDTLIAFIVPFVIITAILIAICYIKGEKPRWRWGK